MKPAILALRQLRFEQRGFWRNPAAASFTLAFPLVILLIFGILMSDGTVAGKGGIPFMYVFAPSVLGFGVIGATFTNLAMSLSIQRDTGVLKRIAGTPLPRGSYIGGKVLSSLCTSGVVTLTLGSAGILVFGVAPRTAAIAGLFLTLGVGAFCFASLGIAVTILVPNGESATAVVNGILLPIVFISGIFPIDNAPQWLLSVARFFPVEHFFHALQLCYDPRIDGAAIDIADLLAMAGWGVVGIVLAVRYFRWEPRA